MAGLCRISIVRERNVLQGAYPVDISCRETTWVQAWSEVTSAGMPKQQNRCPVVMSVRYVSPLPSSKGTFHCWTEQPSCCCYFAADAASKDGGLRGHTRAIYKILLEEVARHYDNALNYANEKLPGFKVRVATKYR